MKPFTARSDAQPYGLWPILFKVPDAMRAFSLSLLCTALLAAGCTTAPPARTAAPGISASDATIIREYYRSQSLGSQSLGSQSPGQARGQGRNGGLPPGIARNLQRGKPLPPGIARQQLPGDLLVRVRPPSGYQYLLVAGRVVLIETATHVVRDVLTDVLFN